jgi:hypothetical protein
MKRKTILSAEKVKALSYKLSKCENVTKFNKLGEPESWTLAISMKDLEESFVKFLDEQLPQLVNENLTGSEINDLLLDIGEEFRHILYHIKDPKFYEYLREDA